MNLPPHLGKFLVSSLTNIAPTNTNLARWGKILDSSCQLCRQPKCTTAHVLGGCQFALREHRFTWRHNSILHSIHLSVKKLLEGSRYEILADLPTRSYERADSINTIPEDIAAVADRPDLTIIDRRAKRMIVVELTAPFDTNLATWENEKETRYNRNLIPTLKENGWNAEFIHIGVGALGTIPRSTKEGFFAISKFDPKCISASCNEIRSIALTLMKIAISCSFVIFRERNNTLWVTPSPRNLLRI
jgi:hypothetical protein